MKRIVSAALLLMMLLAFTACDKAQTSQNPSQSATENSEQTLAATETPTTEITQETATAPAVTATATPTIEITQAPTATPTLEITKQPTATAPQPVHTFIVGNWGWEQGKGAAENLSAAAEIISNKNFVFSQQIADLDIFVDSLQPILQEYNVYLYKIVITSEGFWDSYDEYGKFYGGTFFELEIVLKAGEQEITIENIGVTYGYRFPQSTVDYSKYNIQTISKLIYTSEYGWELGMGNSDNLKKAIDEIVALDFEFLNECDFVHDTGKEIQEKAIQSITPILEKYDVYVYYIWTDPGPLWSGYDENGSFISGQAVKMTIALGAGNMIASVHSY